MSHDTTEEIKPIVLKNQYFTGDGRVVEIVTTITQTQNIRPMTDEERAAEGDGPEPDEPLH